MTNSEKYAYAMRFLRELNCPEAIMDALAVWGIFVRQDEIKLANWVALAGPGVIEGQVREV